MDNYLSRLPHKSVRVDDSFWTTHLDKIRNVTVPDVLNKFLNKDGILKNYQWVIEGKKGEHIGPPWYDGLLCETIRGISDFIAIYPDDAMVEKIEAITKLITAAQDKDGYINTYVTLIVPDHQWGQNGGSLLFQHELYNMGCLIEAGVHFYEATGRISLLKCAVKAANCMANIMGAPPKKNLVPSHQLPEEALLKLYHLLKDNPSLAAQLEKSGLSCDIDEYLRLFLFWIDNRGNHENRASYPPYMGEYAQDHIPILQQKEAVGHSVRACLYYTAVTLAAMETNSGDYAAAANTLWDNVTLTKMHISGGVGAVHNEEKFGYQYILPDNAYLETCAGIAFAFWAGEMHRLNKAQGKYMDVFECALYNNVLPGLSIDGDKYFYQNPLTSDGTIERWEWHDCPCCPPMFLKLMGSLQDYIYSVSADAVYVNMHIGSSAKLPGIEMTQKNAGLPFTGGTNCISVNTDKSFPLYIRIPEWVGQWSVKVNGEKLTDLINKEGYICIDQLQIGESIIEMQFDLPIRMMQAHPYVADTHGKVAITKGPLLYCLEETDNNNLKDVILSQNIVFSTAENSTLNATIINGKTAAGKDFTAIPYYLWSNRGKGKMEVWLKLEGYQASVLNLEGWQGKLYREYKGG